MKKYSRKREGEVRKRDKESGPAGRRRRWVQVLALLVAVGLGVAACGEKGGYKAPPPPKVTVSQPVVRPVTDYLEFTGNTQAINSSPYFTSGTPRT